MKTLLKALYIDFYRNRFKEIYPEPKSTGLRIHLEDYSGNELYLDLPNLPAPKK